MDLPVRRLRPSLVQPPVAAPGWADVGMAIAMGASVLIAMTAAADARSPADLPPLAWFATGAVTVATLLFRAAPLAGLLLGTVALLGYHVAVGDSLGLAWPLVVVVYGVARAGHLRIGAGFSGVYLVAVFAHRAVGSSATDGVTLLHAAAQEGLLLAGALLTGEVVRTRVLQAETARERLALLQRNQAEEMQRRIAEERLRIAHDLHDLTAHSVSVISLHAGVARERFGRDPAQARASLATIEQTSRQAAEDLRGLVGLLRSSEPPPSDGLDAIHRAVETARNTGLTVDLGIEPSGLSLAGPVGLATARIVQESLTNVLRHADARHATVTIRGHDGVFDVSIVDDGVGPSRGAGSPHRGVGLQGMRERIELLGGTLSHGAAGSVGGFRVHARLPSRRGS